MFNEICNFISCAVCSAGLGILVSYIIDLWENKTIKEEEGGSILYINKEVDFNG